MLYTLRSGANQHTEDSVLQFITDILSTPGVIDLGDNNHFLVQAQDTPDMTVKVNIGRAFIKKTGSNTYPVRMDAVSNVAVEANSSGNNRIDTLVLYIDLSTSANPQASNVAKLKIVKGTPAASPTAPSDSDIANDIGSSNPYIELADITVNNGATSIIAANISDVRAAYTLAVSGGAAFWSDMPETATRVSDTQFTMPDVDNAGLYDKIFTKGTILKWLEGATFQTAMVISSSYAGNVCTVNTVGDSLTAGFTDMMYCLHKAIKNFGDGSWIIPTNLPTAATTNISKSIRVPEDWYVLSGDLRLGTAGSGTGSSILDINDDGVSKFGTKPTITSTGTEDNDNVADNPSTIVAAGSIMTLDWDSSTSTPGADAYAEVWGYPASWRYRS